MSSSPSAARPRPSTRPSTPRWTSPSATALVGDVRTAAVADAAAKAADYARALGRTTVEPLAVADVGMLGDGARHAGVADEWGGPRGRRRPVPRDLIRSGSSLLTVPGPARPS